MDSLEWRKKYEVLSISRLYLHSLEFTPDQIALLSEEDMQRIADTWNNQHFIEFEEDMKFIVSLELAEKSGLCNACLTWVATHQIQVGNEVYTVCDKPSCQDRVSALKDIRRTE